VGGVLRSACIRYLAAKRWPDGFACPGLRRLQGLGARDQAIHLGVSWLPPSDLVIAGTVSGANCRCGRGSRRFTGWRAIRPDITNEEGTNLDPFRAWKVMMAGEKPGGHGERCVAVGTLDMAIWDAAAKDSRCATVSAPG
jgi:hypothetical protein